MFNTIKFTTLCVVILIDFPLFAQYFSFSNDGNAIFNTLNTDTNFTHAENYTIYFNPLSGKIEYNRFARPCEKYIDPLGDYKFHFIYSQSDPCYSPKSKLCIRDGEQYYFNTDSLLVMSGYFEGNEPHGVFWLYCDKEFPYCAEVSESPVRQVVFHQGKKLLDIRLDNKGQPFGEGFFKKRGYQWDE